MRISRRQVNFGPSRTVQKPSWIAGEAPYSDVVLSTRARLARNLVGAPFPHAASDEDLARVAKYVLTATQRIPAKTLKSLHPLETAKLTDEEKAALVDSHLSSVAHVVAGRHRFAMVDDRHTVSVLINEEDHIRIQAILPGFQPEAAYRRADDLDDALAAQLPFAYDAHLGFLTASLANCGMGLRLSVMVHLPALSLTNTLPAKWHAAKTLGAAVRGLYGEDVGLAGDIYQVSNAVSLGLTEDQTIGRLNAVTTFLRTEEVAARGVLASTRFDEIAEMVADANDQLQHAATLTLDDGIRLLSVLRLGWLMGMDTFVSDSVFNELVASLRGGTSLVVKAGDRARDVFYEDTRRPALFRNRIRMEIAAKR